MGTGMDSPVAAVVLLLLLAAAGCTAQVQPAHFSGGGRRPGGSKGSDVIAGAWQAFFKTDPDPISRLTLVVQGDAVAVIGVYTGDNSPVTGTGWYVRPQRASYKSSGSYPTYKIYFGTSQPWGGWFTLLALDADTILTFIGENPEIPSPPVEQDTVWKRIK